MTNKNNKVKSSKKKSNETQADKPLKSDQKGTDSSTKKGKHSPDKEKTKSTSEIKKDDRVKSKKEKSSTNEQKKENQTKSESRKSKERSEKPRPTNSHNESSIHNENEKLNEKDSESRKSRLASKEKNITENENNGSLNKRKARDSTNEDVNSASYNRNKYHRSNSKESIYSNRANIGRNYELAKYDENSFKNPINTIPRYARYPFKYHQNFRPSYRYYQQSYQYNTIDYDPEYFINNTTVENEIMTDEEDLEDAVPNGESEFFTLFTNKNSSNKSKISSKIIDMLDIDWSILSTKYFDSSLASTVSSYFDSFKPSFILSTTGVMKECLDDKTFEKVKECIEKENSSGASLETLKKQVDNKIINNFAFKNSGICMRNDIERRKAVYFYQLNKHIEGMSEKNDLTATSHPDHNVHSNDCINQSFQFYQHTLEILNDAE